MTVHYRPVQFAEIVPLGPKFALEAGPEFPLADRVAETEAELVGRLVLSKFPEGTVIDIEMADHEHITLASDPAPVVS